jgi:RNA polymerase-binding transcription factor DksA
MAKRVASLSELFQTVPQPQPQPQPPAPKQPVQPVQLTTGPSQKDTERKRFTNDQNQAMRAFFTLYPHANKKQRRELGELIGLEETQIYFWHQRQKNKHDTTFNDQVVNELIRKNEELTDQNEQLQVQNQNLIYALHNSTCPQCGVLIPYSEVQQSRVRVIPPQLELPQASSDCSIDQSLLRRDVQNLVPTSVERRSSQLSSVNLPATAHDLVGVSTDQIADIVRKAKDELLLMATAGFPLWISSPNLNTSIHPEILQREEYSRVFQREEPAPYFKSESSRHSATIQLIPTTIVQILMDVGQWLLIFYSMVTNAKTLEVLSSGIEGSYMEQK